MNSLQRLSYHFLVFLLLNLNRRMFIEIVAFNFEIDFFQTIKCCYHVQVQATSLLKKKALKCLRNNLAHLGEYSTGRGVADISNLFYFHFVFI